MEWIGWVGIFLTVVTAAIQATPGIHASWWVAGPMYLMTVVCLVVWYLSSRQTPLSELQVLGIDQDSGDAFLPSVNDSPIVLLAFESGKLYGFHADEIANVPLVVRNDGGLTALDIRIETIRLSDEIVVSFRPIPSLAAHTSLNAELDVEETHEDGVVLDHPNHFGWAIRTAHIFRIYDGQLQKHREWLLTTTYRDVQGRAYESVHQLTLDGTRMRAVLVFVRRRLR